MQMNAQIITYKKNSDDRADKGKAIAQEGGAKKKNLAWNATKKVPIPDDLIKKKLIDLAESKWPEEAGRTNDMKYCKYHRLVGHPIEDRFIFKDKVMQLVEQGTIILEMSQRRTWSLLKIMVDMIVSRVI